LKMELISCSETSIINYQHSLRNNPEDRSYLLRDWSVKSHILVLSVGKCRVANVQ
jgi:hypothetical protein